MRGLVGNMLSGGKVRDKLVVNAFCFPSKNLVG